MRARRAMAIGLLGMTSAAHAQTSQYEEKPPFAAGALMVGALGFARPPITTSVIGGYGYAPLRELLIGGQGGGTIADRGRSNASYGLATVGYAFDRAERRQFYPFVGFGAGVLRARRGPNHAGLLGGAGLGADILLGSGDHGLVVGTRAGYIARSVNDDESVAYFAVTFGAGGRRQRSPTTVVAHR
jgi:hypothetical protein